MMIYARRRHHQLKVPMVGRVTASREIHILISQVREWITLLGKKKTKLSTLRWEDCPGYAGPQYNPSVLINHTRPDEATDQGMQQPLEAGRQGKGLPPSPGRERRAQPYQPLVTSGIPEL